jgi:hypothetical protein
MTTRTANCALHLTEDDLSAWRSHLLPTEEQRRIGQHIPTCAACQRTLAGFAAIADAMRNEAVLPSGAPLWHATKAKIAAYERSRMHSSQKYLIAGGLGVLGVLILSFAVILATSLPATSSTSTLPPTASIGPHPTATAGKHHATATPTASGNQILQVSPSQGWVTASALPFGKSVAFGINDPLTGYACGNTDTNNFSSQPLLWSVTHDGGRTWSAASVTPATGAICIININPSNAADIVLFGTGTCPTDDCSIGGYPAMYLTHDGGTTWQPLALTGTPKANISIAVWAGNDLFIIGSLTAPQSFIAVSINGGPFTLLNQSAIYPGIGNELSPIDEFSVGSTLVLSLYVGSCAVPGSKVSCPLAITSDNGATWQHYTPTGPAAPSQIIVGGDDQTLFGYNANGLVVSHDIGRTWQRIPNSALPLGPNEGLFLSTATPDGTVFAQTITSGTYGPLEKFPVGGSQWVSLGKIPGWQFQTVSWTPNGQPLALWAESGAYNRHQLSPGIAYHAP